MIVRALLGASATAALICGTPAAVAAPPAASPPSDNAATESAATADEASATETGDIIVTAQRRAERLQDVPVAVSVVSGAQLALSGVRDVLDLRVAVPALNITSAQGYTLPRLRGIGNTGRGPGVENAVATYVDGVYYASPAAALLQLSNIERIEVLKGPQGTLFGRNATGGLIQIITRDPPKDLSGNFNVSVGNYDTVRAEAYIGTGLTDSLSGDVSVYYMHQGDGWGTNLGTGHDIYAVDHDWGVRSKLVFEPHSGTKISLTADYSSVASSMNVLATLEGTRGFDGQIADYPQRYDTRTNIDPRIAGWQAGAALKIEQSIGELNAVSITAYRDSTYRRQFDFDASTVPFYHVENQQDDDQFSQELQLLSSNSGAFKWVIGGFYLKAHGIYKPNGVFFEAASRVPPPGVINATFSRATTDSIAGYAQGSYEVLPGATITLGGRLTHETKGVSGRVDRSLNGNAIPVAQPPVQKDVVINKFTYRASFDYKFSPDVLGYVAVNRGFRSGGFNAGDLFQPGYGPEQIDAYEVGLKTQFWNRRATINIAAFYYDYTGLQIQKITSGATTVINGPSAKVKGIDADFAFRFSKNFQLSGGVTLLDDRFGTFFANGLIGTPLGGVAPGDGFLTGNRLPNISRLSASIAPQYTIDLPRGGSVVLRADYYYNSGWFPEPDNVLKQRSFNQINGSIVLFPSDSGLNVSLWGRNLTNSLTYASLATVPVGVHTAVYQAPRTYGVSFGFKF